MRLNHYVLILLLVLTGCTKNIEEKDETEKDNSTDYSQQIPVVDEVWLKNKIENRNSKILFINFWATWCEPCVEEFPDLVKIYNEHKNSGLELLSVSVDLPSEIDSKVKPFLKEQSAYFPVVVIEEKRSEEVINLIDPEWNGAVPATVIYDENGDKREFFTQAGDYEFFNESIKKVKNY